MEARGLGPRPLDLDHALVEDVIGRVDALPEPLAAIAAEVEIARDGEDEGEVRRRLYELAAGVSRYAVSIGLAALASTGAIPAEVASATRRAFELGDDRWLELVGVVAEALAAPSPAAARCLGFARSPAASTMVASRRAFLRGEASGDAPACARAMLDAAAELLALPLRVVVSASPPTFEVRHGVPRRRGVWRKSHVEDPGGASLGEAFFVLEGRAVRLGAWLPAVDGALRLVDSPHAPGRAWRCLCPETGEHPEHRELDATVRALAGDGLAPPSPEERPPIVGRERELSLLEGALREAGEGSARVVLITGPQGSGLSRMLLEASREGGAFDPSSRVELRGTSRGAPLGALQVGLRATANPALAGLRRATERLATASHVTDRSGLEAEIEALAERLLEASRSAPLLVSVDDAERLDAHSLGLLALLASRASGGALGSLAVVIAAHDEPAPSAALGELLLQVERGLGAGAVRLALGPLDESGARALARGVAPVARDVLEHAVAVADGLPFRIVESLQLWVESGALDWTSGAWERARGERGARLASGWAGSVALADARLAALFDPRSEASRAADCVLGCITFDSSGASNALILHVFHGMEIDPGLGERVLETLVEARVVVRRHGVLEVPQPTVARALGSRYRERPFWPRLARVVLSCLEEEPRALREAGRLAAGYEALGDLERALERYREALAKRLHDGAFDEARELAERLALRETVDERRFAAGLAAVEAMKRDGRLLAARARHRELAPSGARMELAWKILGESLAESREAVDESLIVRADELEDRSLRLAARLVFARRRRGGAGRSAVEEALAILGDGDDAADTEARHRLLSLDLELLYESGGGGVATLRRAATRARAAARRTGSAWAELRTMVETALLDGGAGYERHAIAELADVAERAGAAYFGSLRREALTIVAELELRLARAFAARAHAMTVEAEATAAGDTRLLSVALALRAECERVRGDLEGAAALASEATRLRERRSVRPREDAGVREGMPRRSQ